MIARLLLALLASVPALAQVPGAPQARPVALTGGVVHTVSGETIDGGAVLMVDGRIAAVGRQIDIPGNAERIDVSGRHVYPALLAADTDLGLTEIGSVRATRDQSETGLINPNARAERAVNPDSEILPTTRSNGVLLAVVRPEGALLRGTSALVQLDGWTWEQMTVRAPLAMHVSWPGIPPRRSTAEGDDADGARDGNARLRQLREALDDARAYLAAREADATTPFDARWDAMAPLLQRRIPLVAHADDLAQIESAAAFAAEQNLRLVIVGGYDAESCADLLKSNGVGVVVRGVHRLPQRRGDAYDSAFTLPARLRDAGVAFAIASDRGASFVRNLPYHAATAAAFGLPRDEALRAVTLYPARLFGVDDRVGSLDIGKDATLFVADGDILETPTQVTHAWVQGRAVDLADRHKRLDARYRERYRRLGATRPSEAP